MAPRQRKSPARARPEAATAAEPPAAAPVKEVSWDREQSLFDVVLNNYAMPLLIMLATPYLTYVVTYITSLPKPTLGTFLSACYERGLGAVHMDLFSVLRPTAEAATVLLVFNFLALLIYWWPGKTEFGPITAKGAKPEYMDNGVAHSILFTLS